MEGIKPRTNSVKEYFSSKAVKMPELVIALVRAIKMHRPLFEATKMKSKAFPWLQSFRDSKAMLLRKN